MDENSWFKERKYLHFDQAIGQKKASQIVCNPSEVATHAFYPFLGYKIRSRKIFKDKGSICYKDKDREIAYASHIDAHIYSYYCTILSQEYEHKLNRANLENNVLAFRKLGKSNIGFAKIAFDQIRDQGACSVICFDITKFFSNMDHEILKAAWNNLLGSSVLPPDHYAVFKSLTKYSSADRDKVYAALEIPYNGASRKRSRICSPEDFRKKVRGSGLVVPNKRDKGIPQGSPISAFLSNLYMFNFDKTMKDAVEEQGGHYYRYCDDMLFITPTRWRDTLAGFVRTEIKKLKIDINPSKTEIRDFKYVDGTLASDKPLQYLGFMFDGNQVILRSAGLARYSERMRRGVNLAKKTQLKRNRKRIARGVKPTKLYRKKLYESYSHLGRMNYVRYGLRAANEMESRSIRKQLKPLWGRLQNQINGQNKRLR